MVHEVIAWPHLSALVAVGAALLVVYLGFRRSTIEARRDEEVERRG